MPGYREEGRKLFGDTPRGREVLRRFCALDERLPDNFGQVLLAVTRLGWQSPDLRFEASNADVTAGTDLPWNDVLTITRALERAGVIAIGDRVDYSERRDIFFLRYLEGVPAPEPPDAGH